MNRVVEPKMGEVARLCRDLRVRRLELFGSAAEDGFNPESSDLDVLVEFEPATPVEHAQRYFEMLAGLEDLFEREVDLVEIRAVRNPYFLKSIQTSRQLLYAA